jgi:hypothetical protein
MAGIPQVSVLLFPTEKAEYTEFEVTVTVTATGGELPSTAFGVSMNSGVACEYFTGGQWVTLNSENWEVNGDNRGIASGYHTTYPGVRLRTPRVDADKVSSIDFTGGYYDSQMNFVKGGTYVTKSLIVTDAPDYTLYYVAGAAGIAAAAVIGYALFRRK